MKVAVYYNNKDIRVVEKPKPKTSEGEILVKVKASGICGTDVMEWYRIKKAPRVLGHEITGEIIESKSNKFKIGQRVFVSHHVPCNKCKYCLENNQTACETLHKGNYDPGGFSEFIRVPKINVEYGVYLLPENVSYEEGTMIEPLGCVIRGQRIINIKKNHTVLVLGSGVSGLLNIQLAKLKGAKVIATDIEKYRLEKAKNYGADKVIDVSKEEINVKADRIIICTGAMQAVQQAFNSIDKKGIILFFAIPNKNIEMSEIGKPISEHAQKPKVFDIPIENFWRNEWTLISSYGAAPEDLKESLELIKDKKINVKDMITHKLPLDKIQEGFDIVANAKESLKVVIEP